MSRQEMSGDSRTSPGSNDPAGADNAADMQQAQPEVPESRYDLQILRSIRRVIRAVDIHSRKLEASCRLTSPQLVCLTSIIDHEPTTTTSIARDVYLSASTVVGIIDRLESRGLVTRDRDDADRRIVNIRSTEKGRRLVREAPSVLQDNLSESLRHLPLLEQATIALSLEQVVNLMEAGHLEAAPILETDRPEPDADRRGASQQDNAKE